MEITLKDESGKYLRVVRFYITGKNHDIITLSQWKDLVTLKWRSPSISSGTGNYDNSEMARLHAQAMLQAADLMDEWSQDTGKEIE